MVTQKYGNYVKVNGILNDQPAELIKEIKEMMYLQAEEDMHKVGIDINDQELTWITRQEDGYFTVAWKADIPVVTQ